VARQVEAAGQIQRRMIPASAPTIPGLGFGRVYDPSLQLSGDFYDFLELPEGRVGLVIADVVGKGLPAALMMASVRSALRGYAARPDLDVHEVVAAVNEYMVRDTKIGEFATLVYGVFSDDGHRFRYCNAGHDAPLLFRDDRFVELTTGGMVLGVRSQEPFEADTIELAAGDLLVLTTDGVSEAISYEGEAYGRERLYASLRKHRELDPQPLARQILWDVRRFVGLAEQSDDITIVVVKAASR
ncbi:MAG: PP2C family protein-serine/threonine phosphatase, partial [Phycisphaerae bacterium]